MASWMTATLIDNRWQFVMDKRKGMQVWGKRRLIIILSINQITQIQIQHIALFMYLALCLYHFVYPTPSISHICVSCSLYICLPPCMCPTPYVSSFVFIPLHVYPISYFPLNVSHSLCVYLTLCLSHSKCIQLNVYSFHVYLILCPTPCTSQFVYLTLYISHSTIVQLRESPTSISHSVYIPPYISHPVYPTLYALPYVSYSACVLLCMCFTSCMCHSIYVPLHMSPTPFLSQFACFSSCESHFMCIPLLCIFISNFVCIPLLISLCIPFHAYPTLLYTLLSHFVFVSILI